MRWMGDDAAIMAAIDAERETMGRAFRIAHESPSPANAKAAADALARVREVVRGLYGTQGTHLYVRASDTFERLARGVREYSVMPSSPNGGYATINRAPAPMTAGPEPGPLASAAADALSGAMGWRMANRDAPIMSLARQWLTSHGIAGPDPASELKPLSGEVYRVLELRAARALAYVLGVAEGYDMAEFDTISEGIARDLDAIATALVDRL